MHVVGQVAQALRNTAIGLASAGAAFDDVMRLTFYVTQWSPVKIERFLAGIDQVAEEIGLPTPMPPASLIGVDYLFEPDVLVEIEATAVIDSVALVRTSAGALASQLSPFPAYRRRDGIDERDWSVGKGSPCGDEFAHGALNPVVTDRAWAVVFA